MNRVRTHSGASKVNCPDVFLSYAREDLPLVEWEAGSMRLGGLNVFLDVRSLRAGTDWPQELRQAIRDANRFVLFWSRYSANSEWVRNEYGEALAIRRDRPDERYLQICKLDETPLPSGLAEIQYVDRSREELLIVASDAKKNALWSSGFNEMLSSGIVHIERVTPRTTKVIAHEADSLVSVRSEQLRRFRRVAKLPSSLKLPAWALKDTVDAANRTLILIPGFLGSHIGPEGRAIWLNAFRLLRGKIIQLRVDQPGIGEISVLDHVYSSFLEQSGLSMSVMPCPYDWRLSFEDSARSLATLIASMLERNAVVRPIFVAHGSGSFVVRALAAFYPELWKECQERGARLIFVGAPENGTYAAVEILTNTSDFLRKLAILDISHSVQEIHEIFMGFPSLYELLPTGKKQDLLDPEFWRLNAFEIDERALAAAREIRAAMGDSISPDEINYIYGAAETTVTHISWDNNLLKKRATQLGDGLAPYDLTFPDAEPQNVYYATGNSAALLANPVAVRAIVDLAVHGQTDLLSQVRPVTR